MKDVILIADAGWSSLKISVFEIKDKKIKDKIYNIFLEKNDTKIVFHINKKQESITEINGDAILAMIKLFESWWRNQKDLHLVATGHRIVHGGKISINPFL